VQRVQIDRLSYELGKRCAQIHMLLITIKHKYLTKGVVYARQVV